MGTNAVREWAFWGGGGRCCKGIEVIKKQNL